MIKNLLELVDIDEVIQTTQYINMVDISVEDDSSFLLANGIISHNSAGDASRQFRNQQQDGIFKIKGKFANVSKMTDKKILFNEKGEPTEALNLMNALGIELNKKIDMSKLRFNEIIIASDGDVDGDAICGLLTNFLFRWEELFKEGKVYRLLSPIISIKKGNDKKLFYTLDEFEEYQKKNSIKGYEISYKKGLGSLEDDEYEDIIKNTKKIQINYDNMAKENLECWFGENVELRKKQLS
jgi:DNA topoisomerase-2